MSATFKEEPKWSEAEGGRATYCQHHTDSQVHCCFCHNGFLFPGMIHDPECPYYELFEDTECPECEGTGIMLKTCSPPPSPPCETCGGTGKVRIQE